MKRKISQTAHLGLVLFLICFTAALLLSVCHELTEGAIESKKESVDQEALREVLPQASRLTKIDLETLSYDKDAYATIEQVYEAPEGFAIKAVGSGYANDPIEMAVGIDREGKITGLAIISHSETPGLGARATEESFRSQFIGKSADTTLTVTKSGADSSTEIDALTGATRTSEGVTREVNLVLSFYTQYLKDLT